MLGLTVTLLGAHVRVDGCWTSLERRSRRAARSWRASHERHQRTICATSVAVPASATLTPFDAPTHSSHWPMARLHARRPCACDASICTAGTGRLHGAVDTGSAHTAVACAQGATLRLRRGLIKAAHSARRWPGRSTPLVTWPVSKQSAMEPPNRSAAPQRTAPTHWLIDSLRCSRRRSRERRARQDGRLSRHRVRREGMVRRPRRRGWAPSACPPPRHHLEVHRMPPWPASTSVS